MWLLWVTDLRQRLGYWFHSEKSSPVGSSVAKTARNFSESVSRLQIPRFLGWSPSPNHPWRYGGGPHIAPSRKANFGLYQGLGRWRGALTANSMRIVPATIRFGATYGAYMRTCVHSYMRTAAPHSTVMTCYTVTNTSWFQSDIVTGAKPPPKVQSFKGAGAVIIAGRLTVGGSGSLRRRYGRSPWNPTSSGSFARRLYLAWFSSRPRTIPIGRWNWSPIRP